MKQYLLNFYLVFGFIALSLVTLKTSSATNGDTPYRSQVSIKNLNTLFNKKHRSGNSRSESTLQISGRIYGLGFIDARLKKRAFKRWRAMIRKNGVDQRDPLEPVLLQGSIAVGGGWRKSGRRVFPTSASLIGSELKVTFPGRIRGKAKRRQRVYTIRVKIDGSVSVRARVRTIPRSIGRTKACASTGESNAISAIGAELNSSSEMPVILPIDSSDESTFSRVVTISTDADPEWFGVYGSESNAVIASIINAAEAIYSRQLGIRFRIVKQHVYTDGSPYGTTDPGALLSRFTRNRENRYNLAENPSTFDEEVDIKHLFTGKNFDGSVIGIAYIGVVCAVPALSYGITQHYMDIADVGIFAHELGHNFGAQHDSTRKDGIMYPSISVPPALDFSSTSVAEMQEHISKYDACVSMEQVAPLPEEPEVTPTPNQPEQPDMSGATLTVRRSRVRLARHPIVRLFGHLQNSDGVGIGGVTVRLLVAGEEVAQGETSPSGQVKFFVRLLVPRHEKVYVYLETADGELFSNFIWMSHTAKAKRH